MTYTYYYLLTHTVVIFFEAAVCLLTTVRGFQRKKGFGWKLSVLVASTILVVFLFPYLYSLAGVDSVYLTAFSYVFASAFVFGYYYFLFDMKLHYILFYTTVFMLASFASTQFGYVILSAIQSSFGNINAYYKLLTEGTSYLVVYTIEAVIYLHRFREKIELASISMLAYFLSMLFCFSLGLSEITAFLNTYGSSYTMMITLCSLFYALVMSIILYYLLNQGESEAEIAAVKQLWIEDKKHYEIQKENLEMINIKVHDLKHQLQDVRNAGELSEGTFAQLEESADIYQSIVQTGNEVLDVVLSSVSLKAQKEKILFTCMADGEALSFLDDSDLYSFFVNLLDNALEHEEKIGSDRERFISLTIRRKDEFLFIHEENLYSGENEGKDIIATTKEDKENHGIGTKSMRKMVEKYKGEISFFIEDGMFQVDVKIPVPEGEG